MSLTYGLKLWPRVCTYINHLFCQTDELTPTISLKCSFSLYRTTFNYGKCQKYCIICNSSMVRFVQYITTFTRVSAHEIWKIMVDQTNLGKPFGRWDAIWFFLSFLCSCISSQFNLIPQIGIIRRQTWAIGNELITRR